MKTSASKMRIPLSIEDITKRVFLGKPLITEDLAGEKLSNPVALGALSPDAIEARRHGLDAAEVAGAGCSGLVHQIADTVNFVL